MKSNIKTEKAKPGCAPSGWLGCVFGILPIGDNWDKYLLMLATLYLMGTCIWILWEEYRTHLNRKKRDRKNQQPNGEPHDPAGGNLGVLGKANIKGRPGHLPIIISPLHIEAVNEGLNFSGGRGEEKRLYLLVSRTIQSIRKITCFLWCHKQPNEKS